MRTFALVAFLAAYASAGKVNNIFDSEDDETADAPAFKHDINDILGDGDVAAEIDEGDGISDALEGDADDILSAEEGEVLGGDDEAIEEGISDEALAASIDGALA